MKKRILFIVSNMESGGVSKSITTLLNVIDTNRFDIDVLILNPTGVFMKLLPLDINIISDTKTQLLFSKFPNSIVKLLKKGYLYTATMRFIAAFFMVFNKGLGAKLLSRCILKIHKEYDLAVDYNGQHQLYYLVDYVNAKVKVSFFHSDYTKWDYYYSMDKKYYSKVDRIFTISDICVAAMKKYFPKEKNKIQLFENISSLQLIQNLAESPIDRMAENSIVSVGHLSEQKGSLLALDVALILKNKGVSFKWYFIGDDSKDHDYVRKVSQNGLQDYIVFIGVTPNPYPYIKNAKIVVHLSYFEGKSIALDEAKLLCKPIVVANFSTVNDQFKNGYNATITDFDKNVIVKNIIELLQNKELQKKYRHNLKKEYKSNLTEVEKLYSLF